MRAETRLLRSALPAFFLISALAPSRSAAFWPTDPTVNMPLSRAGGAQARPRSISDATGGALVVWEDQRSGSSDIYAQHVLASGAVDPAWPADGRALCAAAGDQPLPTTVSADAGGA